MRRFSNKPSVTTSNVVIAVRDGVDRVLVRRETVADLLTTDMGVEQ